MRLQPEQENRQPGGRITGLVSALLLCLCIITIAFLTYQKSMNPGSSLKDLLQKFTFSNVGSVKAAQKEYSFEFDKNENATFAIYGEYIVKCSSSGVWFMDRTGEVVRAENIAFNNPVIKKNGSYLLIADLGSSEICVLDDKGIRWRQKLDEPVLNADISGEGYVTAVTSAKRDNNIIRVIEPHGIEMFQIVIANDFAVSAGISPSGENLAVSAISTGAAGVYSHYHFYDMKGKDLAELSFDASEEILPLFWFFDKSRIFAAGDRSVAAFDATGKVIWEKQFSNLAGAEISSGKRLAVAAEGDKGYMLELFNADGKVYSSGSLEEKPKGLSTYKGIIAVTSADKVYFYNEKCRNISRYEAGAPVSQVYFLSRQQAVVITDHEVTIVNLE
ncbi:MAG TPA: DUF5711 family protein [Clostridia bacterium]|nr:DUF5711 family protein [Clostridia bacterium]